MKKIISELENYNLFNSDIDVIQNKEGICVCRIKASDKSYILKYFENIKFRREISYYKLFDKIGIKTIKLIGHTDKSILLEDISASKEFRLGTKEDFENKNIISALAKWYKLLHLKGKDYANQNELYSEWDYFNELNLNQLAKKFNLNEEVAFVKLMNNYIYIKKLIEKTPKTLIYQDFYYTNMVVSKDEKKAFMFDYNMLGKGSYITDIKNVTYWFNEKNKKLFIDEYGAVDKKLMLLEETISPFIALIMAMKRNIFPNWVETVKNEIKYNISYKIDKLISNNL